MRLSAGRATELNYIRHSFKRKLFFTVLTVTLILVVSAGFFTLHGFKTRIEADHEEEDLIREALVGDKINEIFSLTENALDRISSSKVIRGALVSDPASALAVYSELYKATNEIRPFSVIDLYVGESSRFSTRSRGPSGILPTEYGVLLKADQADGATVYDMDPSDASTTGSTLIIVRKLSDIGEKGYAVVRIDREQLTNELGGSINARDGFVLANRFFRPFCLIGTAVNSDTINKLRRNFMQNVIYNKDIKDNVYISGIGDSGLVYVYITPPAFEDAALRSGYQVVLLMVVISIVLCLFVASRMSTSIARPISTLTAAMKQFRRGDFDTRVELTREDEFGQLAFGFNKMTSRLKDTMQERVEAERKVNEARIELMQAQLNPHFLYNTLDTIKWVAKANHVPEVATLSSSLAMILRTGISENQFCKLQKELDLVRNYCDIQKIRFDDSFDLIVNVAAELTEAYVPKLVLQPLVENAIIHGLEGRRDGCIEITAQRIEPESEDKPQILEITVSDNGKGMSDEMIALIESDDPNALEGHLGIKNVNTIIRLYYGKEYGVRADKLESGARVRVILPFSLNEPGKEEEKPS